MRFENSLRSRNVVSGTRCASLFLILLAGVLGFRAEAQLSKAATDLVHAVMQNEKSYWTSQKDYACTFEQLTVRKYGSSAKFASSSIEIMIAGGEMQSEHSRADLPTVMSVIPHDNDIRQMHEVQTPEQDKTPVRHLFATWDDPLFGEVLQHSIFEQITGPPTSTDHISTWSYRPNLLFRPKTQDQEIANALSGVISISTTEMVFVRIFGMPATDVVAGHKFLVGARLPVLDYLATKFRSAWFPKYWSEASFRPVRNDRSAYASWLDTVQRTIVAQKECHLFHTSERILPGYNLLPLQQTDPSLAGPKK